jgi:TolA-binding protein
MKHLALSFLALMVAVGCASKNDPTEEFDKNLNVTTTDKTESVGMKGDKVMIKKKVHLEEQLYKMQTEIEDLELAIYGKSKRDPGGIYDALKDCRGRVADPRVGGNGKPEPMEKWERLTQTDETFQYKGDKAGNMVGYSEEELDQRLVRYQKQKALLEQSYENFKDRLDTCESRYRTALVQHGLNPNDTKAKGEWVDGPNGYKVWKMRQGATQDPEELMRRKEKTVQSGG